MTFARWLFRVAAIYGLLVLLPQYFMEERIGRDFPPPLNHLENFYGFLGVAIVWQIGYLLISHDPYRYRPFMLVAFLAKASFGLVCVVLFVRGDLAATILVFGIFDLVLGVLFIIAWWKTRANVQPSSA